MTRSAMVHGMVAGVLLASAATLVGNLGGCAPMPLPPGPTCDIEEDADELFYIGSNACSACHPDLAERFATHSHGVALVEIQGVPPEYPGGEVPPQLPTGFEWADIAYVIGGFNKGANFLGLDGYVLTDGTEGTATLYNRDFPQAGLEEGLLSFLPDQLTPLEYTYDCFRCHVTGGESFDTNGGRNETNRVGIAGTWSEPGVTCEACHGPGSCHVTFPSAGNIIVNTLPDACADCHANPDDPEVIAAEDDLIVGYQQVPEVAASPHTGFSCTLCHDPHLSTLRDPDNGLRNTCRTCHPNQSMALHEDAVFQWGDYTEEVTCESCHMPYAAKNAVEVTIDLPGDFDFRMGDTRSHIMRIDSQAESATAMFSEDGTEVVVDEQGRAALTPCYVCQRCHNGQGNVFLLLPADGCKLGAGIHEH